VYTTECSSGPQRSEDAVIQNGPHEDQHHELKKFIERHPSWSSSAVE
jgi:hypothetical protein